MIAIQCPQCHLTREVSECLAGLTIVCTHCHARIHIERLHAKKSGACAAGDAVPAQPPQSQAQPLPRLHHAKPEAPPKIPALVPAPGIAQSPAQPGVQTAKDTLAAAALAQKHHRVRPAWYVASGCVGLFLVVVLVLIFNKSGMLAIFSSPRSVVELPATPEGQPEAVAQNKSDRKTEVWAEPKDLDDKAITAGQPEKVLQHEPASKEVIAAKEDTEEQPEKATPNKPLSKPEVKFGPNEVAALNVLKVEKGEEELTVTVAIAWAEGVVRPKNEEITLAFLYQGKTPPTLRLNAALLANLDGQSKVMSILPSGNWCHLHTAVDHEAMKSVPVLLVTSKSGKTTADFSGRGAFTLKLLLSHSFPVVELPTDTIQVGLFQQTDPEKNQQTSTSYRSLSNVVVLANQFKPTPKVLVKAEPKDVIEAKDDTEGQPEKATPNKPKVKFGLNEVAALNVLKVEKGEKELTVTVAIAWAESVVRPKNEEITLAFLFQDKTPPTLRLNAALLANLFGGELIEMTGLSGWNARVLRQVMDRQPLKLGHVLQVLSGSKPAGSDFGKNGEFTLKLGTSYKPYFNLSTEMIHVGLFQQTDPKKWQQTSTSYRLLSNVVELPNQHKPEPKVVVKSGPKDAAALNVVHVKKHNGYLRFSLPKNTQPDDKLVLVYVDPKTTVKPEEIIKIPAGNIDAVIKDALEKRKAFGLEGAGVLELASVSSSFDFAAVANSQNKAGVYAATKLSRRDDGSTIGTSVTYFKISTWTTERAGEVEIRLPAVPTGSREPYFPSSCELFLFLIGKDGKKLAQGTVKVGLVSKDSTEGQPEKVTQKKPDGFPVLKKPVVERQFKGHEDGISCVAFSSDSQRAATGSFDGSIVVWEVDGSKPGRRFKGHTSLVVGVAFSGDGQRIVSAALDKTVRVWDVQTKKELHKLVHKNGVHCVAFSPDGKYVLSGAGEYFSSENLFLWNASSGELIQRFEGHKGAVVSVQFSPDGKFAISAALDGTIGYWEIPTGRRVKTIHKSHAAQIAFAPDGRRVISSGGIDRPVRLWDVEHARELKILTGHKGWIKSVACCPSGAYAASATNDIDINKVQYYGSVRIWDLETGAVVHQLPQCTSVLSFSPDGQFLLTGGYNGLVYLWRIREQKAK